MASDSSLSGSDSSDSENESDPTQHQQQQEEQQSSSLPEESPGSAAHAAQNHQKAAAAGRPEQIQLIATSTHPTGNVTRRIIPTNVDAGIRMVPLQFQFCEMPDIIALVSSMLDRLLAHNDALPADDRPLTRFHSKAAPPISPIAYLTRITTFTNVDPCVLIILLFYIDKLTSYLVINSLTVHRFAIAAVCCGSKALSDSFATNSRYAKVGGVELVEMNALERELLSALGWRLATSGALLEQYWRSLVEAHPGYSLSLAPPVIPQSAPPPLLGVTPDPSVEADRPPKRSKG